MPNTNAVKITDTPWYGFDYGNIHFVLMSTEHNFTRYSDQYNFLEEDLSSVDRTKTPWVTTLCLF